MTSSLQNGATHSHEPEGRYLSDSFGRPLLVVMEKRYWDYLDWLRAGKSLDKISMHLDLIRKDYTMDEMLMMMIQLCTERLEQGGVVPPAHLRLP